MFSFSFPSKKPNKSSNHMNRGPRRKLERRNAVKNIDYDAAAATAAASPSSPDAVRFTRSLDLSPSYSNQTSFRIGGSVEGEVDLICQSLGLSGPDDFAISEAAWEASRARRSSCDIPPRSRFSPSSGGDEGRGPSAVTPPTTEAAGFQESTARVSGSEVLRRSSGGRDGGIKGVRPPMLTPPSTMMSITTQSAPPTMSTTELNPSPSSVLAPPPSTLLPEFEKIGSSWDLVMAFAPDDGMEEGRRRCFESEEEDERLRLRGEISEDVTSTSYDDDSSSTTTEGMFVISPNGRFKRIIRAWQKGQLLGSGSFGTVYEGISE